jgi:hypothetical protein
VQYNPDYQTLLRNNWYHVAFTLQGTLGTLYLNGGFGYTINSKPINAVTRHKCYIGKSNWVEDPHYVNGLFDDFMIFNRALSSDEIKVVKELTSYSENPFSSNLINYWPFDDNLNDVISSNADLLNLE